MKLKKREKALKRNMKKYDKLMQDHDFRRAFITATFSAIQDEIAPLMKAVKDISESRSDT